jgi:hypothetical protein
MRLPKNNLVAIAYKTGYCGSLIYAISALSPEVAQYVPFKEPSFDDGTAHSITEKWFYNLHDYQDSMTIDEKSWDCCVPPETQQALLQDKLIMFRCHPNTAYKLSFIENLRVLYVTHANKYIPERWAYEKVYRPQGESFFQQDLQRLFRIQKNFKIDDRIKRTQLIKNMNHQMYNWKEIQMQMKISPFLIEIDRWLDKDFDAYKSMCDYLNITPISSKKFISIIDNYNIRQWKRF